MIENQKQKKSGNQKFILHTGWPKKSKPLSRIIIKSY